jgi:hypothetical protein
MAPAMTVARGRFVLQVYRLPHVTEKQENNQNDEKHDENLDERQSLHVGLSFLSGADGGSRVAHGPTTPSQVAPFPPPPESWSFILILNALGVTV